MENVKINFNLVVDYIGEEIAALIEALKNSSDEYERSVYEKIKNINFFVEDEREFVKRKDANLDTVYVVVKFGNSSTNFGAAACPVSLIIMSNRNKLDAAQDFFGLFVSRYSLQALGEASISQIWLTPSVLNAFGEVDRGLRALFTVVGTLVVAASTIRVGTLLYDYDENEEPEEIGFMSFHEGFQNSINPQPFGDKNGFAVSESNFATSSFTVSTYLLNTRFVRDCLKVRGLREVNGSGPRRSSDFTPNSIFKLKIIFNDSEGNAIMTNFPLSESEVPADGDTVLGSTQFYTYKLLSYNLDQKVGDIPSFVASFTY